MSFAFVEDSVFVETAMEKALMMTYTDAVREDQLWGPGSIRVFISHMAEYRALAAQIRDGLTDFEIASFVAHEDIEPTREWQTEIERALFSMDMLVALLTEGFKESNWTDQEVGVAIGRRVPIVSVALGVDPYGFIGKYQAIRGISKDRDQILDRILGVLFKIDGVREEAVDAFIKKVAGANSYDHANSLARYLPMIDQLSPDQEQELVKAFNTNSQVYDAYGFKPGIVDHLKRWTGKNYRIEGGRYSTKQLVLDESISY